MKIGVLTYHSVYNFGANLQCYSTVSYLKNNGYDPIVINWLPKDLESKYNSIVPVNQADAHKKFVENYLPVSNICRTSKEVAAIVKKEGIKLVIVGSDAVMQHKTLIDRIVVDKSGVKLKEKLSDMVFPNPFWGDFVHELDDDFPIVYMSASSMNMNYKLIRGKLKSNIGKALNKYRIVTVRDEWTKRVVKYFTKNKLIPEVTPDPVFAFNQNVLNQVSKEELLQKYSLPENYVLLSFNSNYTVSQVWIEALQGLMEEKGLACVFLATPEGRTPFTKIKAIIPPINPLEWYGLIKYASGYVGERMHPIVVALHNQVPFFSFDAYGIRKFKYFVNYKSSKIYDILDKGGYLNNVINIQKKGYKIPDPEDVVKKIIDFDREQCEKFQKKQLDKYNIVMKKITSIVK